MVVGLVIPAATEERPHMTVRQNNAAGLQV